GGNAELDESAGNGRPFVARDIPWGPLPEVVGGLDLERPVDRQFEGEGQRVLLARCELRTEGARAVVRIGASEEFLRVGGPVVVGVLVGSTKRILRFEFRGAP